MKIKELKEKRANFYQKIEELRSATDGREMTAEEKSNWDQLLEDYEKVDQELRSLERYQAIQKRQLEEEKQNPEQAEGEKRQLEVFRKILAEGMSGVTKEERALLEPRAGLTGVSGGVLIPSVIANAIEVALSDYGGMMSAAHVIKTSTGGDLSWPTIDDTSSKATIIAEYGQSQKGKPTFSAKTFKSFTYRTPIVPVSLELLQDSAFDLPAFLSGLLADSFGRGMNEHFTSGTGTGRPSGILTGAQAVNSTSSAAVTLDDILDVMAAVNSAYQKNAKFMFNQKVLFALMKVKDSDGQYIWQSNVAAGIPPTLFGKAYVLNADMPNIEAAASPVIYGDLSKYKIRMVKGFQCVRLNELLAEWLSVGIMGFGRADGALLDAGTHPVVKLVLAAS